MVSLPNIYQGSVSHLTVSDNTSGSSESDVSKYFCNDCTQSLQLPIQHIDRGVLRGYEEKYAQIRNMQRLFEQGNDGEHGSTFRINDNTRETLQIYSFGFPLINQTNLSSPQTSDYNLEHIRKKILKRQSRCNILHKTSKNRHEERLPRYVKTKVRRLPSLELQIWERHKYAHVESGGHTPQKILIAEPEVIVFDCFEIGGYYEKKCKILNVSRDNCRYHIIPFDNDSQFKVMYNKATNIVPAGLSFYITVQFFCRSLADIKEQFIVRTKHGEDLTVVVKAESDPPCLVEVIDEACNLDRVVDSLVDCGSHFVGEKSKLIVTLKNIGSSSRFCFITESDWLNFNFSIDASNTLLAEPFKIKPMYFSLKKDQVITICVSVTPPSEGLHTTRVLLLCENGSFNNVDFICDGFLFEPSLIDHVNMLKTFDVDKADAEIADCYLDFEKVLTFDNRYFCFFILNTTSVSMSYHWELREVSIPGTENLPKTCLSVAPFSGRLASQMVEMFCLKLNTDNVPPGVYRSLLVLVIDDLPIKCIPLKYHHRLLPCKDEDDGRRSIEAKHIELWVECETPNIQLIPYVVDLSDFPIMQGSKIEKQEITVKNESPGTLYLSWEYVDECSTVKVGIEPSYLKCDQYSAYNCCLSIEGVEEGPFELSLWCLSVRGDAKVQLRVKGYCCKPRLTILTDDIDFGLVKINESQTKALVAKNCSSADGFCWSLEELIFASHDEGLLTVEEDPHTLSTTCGKSCHKNSEILVKYQLPCEEDSLLCRVLNWDGNYIPVVADIHAPDVSFSTYTLFMDPLFLDVVTTMYVTVSNNSLIKAAIFWGCPTDLNLEPSVTVEFEPRCYTLEPQGQVLVEIRVTPHKIGPMGQLFLPCFVEGSSQPLFLKLDGYVEGLRLRVEWNSNDQHFSILWPPTKHLISVSKEELADTILCPCPPNSLRLSEGSCLDCNILDLNSDYSLKLNTDDEESLADTILNDCNYDGVKNEEEIKEDNDEISSISSIPYWNWPIVGGRYTREPMDEEWEEHFNNLFVLEELSADTDSNTNINSASPNCLTFQDVPVRKAVTQTIYIRNDTAIPSSFVVSVVYNFARGHKTEHPHDPEIILKKRKNMYDEYVEQASPHRGLTVFVTPDSGKLEAYDYVTISVTVVALSWGFYSDMIVLQVGDLDHLCVGLNVIVPEPPVIAPNRVVFGSLSLRDPPASRSFTVENVSTVPIYVCWDIYTPTPNMLPFSVMLFDSDPFHIQLANYYGLNKSQFFSIEEKYTYIEPNSSKTLKVKFNPILADINVKNNIFTDILKAIMVGHVYLTDKGKDVTNDEKCFRVDGSKLSPVLISLEALVEIPLLTLLNVFNYQLVFKCTANDVMKTPNKVWNSNNVIRVQNNNQVNLAANVYTMGYFDVSQIEYPCATDDRKHCNSSIFLRPGETCEVTIVCKVTEYDILDCFEPPEPGVAEEESIGVCSVEKGMLCFEQDDVRQDVKLELQLYPPLLQFSENTLDFGTVYVEETKTLIISIIAPMQEEYFEASIKGGEDSAFTLRESSGTLKPRTAHLLQVFFTPSCCTLYQDCLIVRSCMKKMTREILLIGIGTFDYRAHIY